MQRGFFLYMLPSATASATAKKAEFLPPTATASATAKKTHLRLTPGWNKVDS